MMRGSPSDFPPKGGKRRWPGFLFGGWVGMLSLVVCADDLTAYQPLIENSPFLTQSFRNQLGRRDRTAIRFIGYTRIEQTWFFGLYDSKANKAYWLQLDQEEDNIRVERFDKNRERIHINVDGLSFELGLQD